MSRLIRTATNLVKFLMLEKFCELYAEIETETEVTVTKLLIYQNLAIFLRLVFISSSLLLIRSSLRPK